MKDHEPDALLWELPSLEATDDGPSPPEAVLLAYRAGTLPPRETARVEWSLAGSRQARARLAELAGVRLDAPPPAPRTKSTGRFVAALLAAAAIVAVALLLRDRGEPLVRAPRSLPEFELRAEGLATTRGEPAGPRALPEGRVRVFVEPRGDAIPGLRFAVYRADESGLTRLEEPAEVVVDVDRGSAILTAQAERLVGASVGTRPFFVVVTAASRLPSHVGREAEDPVVTLGRAAGGRVYGVPLTIVDATDGAP